MTLEPVSQRAVVRHWLRAECAAAASGRGAGPVVETGATLPDPDAVADLSDRDALDALLRAKPGAAGFLARDERVEWYRTTVDADGFAALRLVESPPGLRWRALAPDRSPVTAARRVAASDPDALAAETGVDARRIHAIRRSLDEGSEPPAAFVVRTRRGRAPWTVVDGNHRAVARAMQLVEIGAAGFIPQPVYLGVRPNPVLCPLRERLSGALWRLLGREPEP